MKYRKPLNIFSILENRMTPTTTMAKTSEIVRYVTELENKYDLDSFSTYEDLERNMSPEDFQKALKIREYDGIRDKELSTFNTQYKNSLRKLFKQHGLPVHINAFDIHRMNIDIENIDSLVERHRNNEDFRTMEFFTDDVIPVFATAPYPLTFIQLENLETYKESIGRLVYESNAQNSSDIKYMMEKTGMTDEDIKSGIRQDCQTYMLVQSYQLDDYVNHVHMYANGNYGGAECNDTLRAGLNIDLHAEGLLEKWAEEKKLDPNEHTEQDIMDTMNWVQIYDVIQVFDDELFLEEQIVTFLDKHGKPTFAKSTLDESNKASDEEVDITSNTQYYLTSCEKVFQWWNSDNDILDVSNVGTTPRWSKGLKKYTKKTGHKTNLLYKTLTVKPTIKVVDEDGVERPPRLEEIVSHMRRGHWAHYGVDGKGLLFGKYAKSVFRKPSVVGKLSNGLIIKDYTLESK